MSSETFDATTTLDEQELLAYLLAEEGIEVGQGRTICPREGAGPAPLSFAQQRLWLLAQMEPDSPFYNLPKAVRLKGALDVAALERSLGEVFRRHDILRTTFRTVDSRPAQVVGGPADFALPVFDLSDLPESEREAQARCLAADEARRPFDLERGPLCRAGLIRLSAAEHVLLVTMHHIVSDAWSSGVFVGEVGALYSSYAAGRPSPLAELPIQYADFAVWQTQWLQGEALEEQLSYWRAQLAGAPPALELPTDRPRPAVQTFRGAVATRVLPQGLCESLKELSRREGVTLFTTLLAAFEALLARYTGQTDIVVGTPVAGRNHVETESLIGCFVNMLVLRAELDRRATFRELMGRLSDTVLSAHANQDVPFEKLVEELQPERALNRNPLFQVVYAHHNAAGAAGADSGLVLEALELESGTAKFDLMLTTEERADGLACFIQYSTDLFDASTAEGMLDRLSSLLASVVSDPAQRLSELRLMSEADERRLLVGWNDTSAEYPRDALVHELFEAQAARTPDAVALLCGDERITYRELNSRADRVALRLIRRGLSPESVVAVLVGRSPELVVALLGVLKAGGAYLPLDPSYPLERLRFMVEDAGAALALTFGAEAEEAARSLSEGAGGTRFEAVRLEEVCVEDAPEEVNVGHARTSLRLSASRLAYVMYTSGSTGRPKGIAVTHRGVVRLVRGASYASFSADETFLLLAPAGFDASTFELWGALLNGARLALAPPHALSLEEVGEVVRRHAVTTLWLTSSLMNLMAEHRPEDLASLRQLLAGGEALSPSHVRRLLAALPRLRLVNGYGPTENTTFTCCHRIEAGEEFGAGGVPIGRPISNTTAYILDHDMRPVPVGIAGELYAGGDGLARGYVNRPALTAEKFVPDPFSPEPGARLYRTGDLCRYLADGRIEFLGRGDGQVKLRGFRIELGEIESALRSQAGVGDAAVVVREGAGGDKRLVAYFAAAAGEDASGEVTGAELREHLRARLPEYMVPSAFVRLDSLPLSSNGKLDRRALPEPGAAADGEAEYVAPRTQAEEMVAGVWGDVLGVGRVGVDDNFFDLGGHSLLATTVMTRLRETLKVELPLRSIFETPTVRHLAGLVEAARRGGADLALPPLERVARQQPPPLSFAQQRLWFHDQLTPGGNTANNVQIAVRLHGRLDVGALGRALNEVVRRHESLRTNFAAAGGQPVQVIAPELSLPLPFSDLRSVPAGALDAEVTRAATEAARRPFDLSQDALLRVALLCVGEDEHVLVLTIHHIISDGWSMGVLIGETAAVYEAFSEGRPSPLAELPIQYADFAVWQREWLRGEASEKHLDYWKRQLGGAPAELRLPADRPRPAVQSFRGAHRQRVLPSELSAAVRELSRKQGVTLFMLTLASFKALLHYYGGGEDIVIGTDVANRSRAQTEGLIGYFVNQLVLRTSLAGDPTFDELLGRVREVSLGAFAHQDLPFDKVVEALRPERDFSRNPLFQVMFGFSNAPVRDFELQGLTFSPVEYEKGTAVFDLSLYLLDTEQGIRGTLRYSTDLFDDSTVERMWRQYETLLAHVVAWPDCRLSELRERLAVAERERQSAAARDAKDAGRQIFKSVRRKAIA